MSAESETVEATGWRVAVTRDEPPEGPLSAALRAEGFVPVSCAVLAAQTPPDPAALLRAATTLDGYDWVVCASARSIAALAAARHASWPRGVRTAAVGPRTAEALQQAGAWPPPLVGDGDGADALWTRLKGADRWPGRRVLVPTTSGGRTDLADHLRDAGAAVEEVEVYRMAPRPLGEIAADWRAGQPVAAVIASSRVASTLILAIGTASLQQLRALVAIGDTTAATLRRAEVHCAVPERADFAEAAKKLRRLQARAAER